MKETFKRSALSVLAVSWALVVAIPFHGLTRAAAQEPVRIGHLTPLTGPVSGAGLAQKAGVEVALEEVNQRVAGRLIVVTHEDYEFKPDVGLTKTRKLLDRDRVDILLGPTGTHVALAIRDLVTAKGIPWILTQSTGKELSPPAKVAPNLFRVGFQYNHHHPIMAKYVLSKLGYRKIAAFGLDYAAGHDETRAFTDAFKQAGGEVVLLAYIPLGAADMAPYVAKIEPGKIDAVFVNLWGIAGPRFIKTVVEFGLKDRVPFFANGTALEDADTLPAAGDSAIGILNYRTYSAQYDVPVNRMFVAWVRAKTGSLPNQYAYAGYLATKVAVKALEATGGRADDKQVLLAALRKVEFEAPGGLFRFDANQQAVKNLFIRKVVKRDGELRNELVDVIPNIMAPEK